MQRSKINMSDVPKYKRVLLKLSGEALAGDKEDVDYSVITPICESIKKVRRYRR